MFTLMTYNQALTCSRMARMMAAMAVMATIYVAESLTTNPTWIATYISLFVAQIIAVKCWADMIIMNDPFKNCWAFEE